VAILQVRGYKSINVVFNLDRLMSIDTSDQDQQSGPVISVTPKEKKDITEAHVATLPPISDVLDSSSIYLSTVEELANLFLFGVSYVNPFMNHWNLLKLISSGFLESEFQNSMG
jgi:hypothetical protein